MTSNEEIVISGISGRYPECQNVEEFKEALLAGRNLTTEDARRYPSPLKGVHYVEGKLPEIDKFDASFFGVHPKQAKYMDPRQRILLETVFESIIDAGYNPCELRGSRTGVFIAAAMIALQQDEIPEDTHEFYFVVNAPYHAANRISFFFDFKGPSLTLDTACSSSLYALTLAHDKIKSGEIDYAIVGGVQINHSPNEAMEYNRVGVLATDGKCKPFNKTRTGFLRSEVVSCCFLQKRNNSKRIYASVLGAKCNTDGFKSKGFSHPSSVSQAQLIREVYDKANISTEEVTYIEKHATGTVVGDMREAQSYLEVFKETKRKPRLIGSVKSNIGHTEHGSGLVSVTKAIIIFESGIIPATINSDPIDQNIPGFSDGVFKLVTKNTPLIDGVVSVTSFGIVGSNSHVALKSTALKKSQSVQKNCRLVQLSGRTEKIVAGLLDEIDNIRTDDECLSLLDEIHKHNVDGHQYRGYTILGKNPVREITQYNSSRRPIWFIFSGYGCQWICMGRDLMHIKIFRCTFNRCAEAVLPYGVDLKKIVMDETSSSLEDIKNCCSAITAITVSLVDLMTSLNIKPDFFAGHSLGEVGCAYVNGDLTPEQAVLLAYGRGYASTKSKLPRCLMDAVGLSKESLNKIIPDDIFIACFNSKDNISIAGPEESIKKFVETLTRQGIFVRIINCGNVAFHSPYLMNSDKYLLEFTKKVLTNPKPRSPKWISTSVSHEQIEEKWAKYNCPEYHVNNYKNQVRFENIYEYVQKDAIVIEIAPHGLLQAILRNNIAPTTSLISLMNRSVKNQEQYLLSSIGKIFNAGGQPNLRNLYNEVKFPVSRGTKMLSPLVKWDHSTSWFVPKWNQHRSFGKIIVVNLSDEKYAFLSGHNIDGRILMPATGLIELVWQVFAEMNTKLQTEIPVVFENVKLIRTVGLAENNKVQFLINIMKTTGNFEIIEGGSMVASGRIRIPDDSSKEFTEMNFNSKPKLSTQKDIINEKDLYKWLHLQRYNYTGIFRGILECDFSATQAKIKWANNFTCFLDSMLHLLMPAKESKKYIVPIAFKKIIIDPKIHMKDEINKSTYVTRDPSRNVIRSKGVEIFCPVMFPVNSRKNFESEPLLESYKFTSYDLSRSEYDFDTCLFIAINIILQNINSGVNRKVSFGEIKIDQRSFSNELITKIKLYFSKQIATTFEFIEMSSKHFSGKVDVLLLYENTVENIEETNITKDTFVMFIGNILNQNLNKLDVVFRSPSLSLLRLKQECPNFDEVVRVQNSNFAWVEKLKGTVANKNVKKAIILSEKEETSGILGLMVCLQAENPKPEFKSIFVIDKAPVFSLENVFFSKQLSKNLNINVFQNNQWGTFIPFPLEAVKPKICENAALSIEVIGDLSTICWKQTPNILQEELKPSEEIVNVHYLSLNFKDVMKSLGKLGSDTDGEVVIGIEYSGKVQNGRSVMGVNQELFTLQTKALPYHFWDVPESWSLKDAATVPIVYLTGYYALIVQGKMQKNESILIHSGAGGVGIAAIRIALSLKATIFVTVSSENKKNFLMKLFPQLDESNFASSRDASFYNLIKTKTKGKGVDLVLNSLAGDLFQTSVSCLGDYGRFLEIGKIDLINESNIDTQIFLKGCSFHGIMLDHLLSNNPKQLQELHYLLQEGIVNGVVQPLPCSVYKGDDIESAIRFMTTGKHMGKIVVQLQNHDSVTQAKIPSHPKVFFNPNKVYIIIGGLGGMGMELANWLFSKGARKIILNARRPVWNTYQSFCINNWLKSNYLLKIDLNDSTTMDGARKLIADAQIYGPVGGIFNTALLLRDSLIAGQTAKDYEEVFKPKVRTSENLDIITRKECPYLDFFVLFSSITASRGFLGLSNYGMANSSLERLCEKRRKDNLPSLAVEWGPVDDVGFLAKEKFETTNFLDLERQNIHSCWEALEKFLISDITVGISVVLGDKIKGFTKEKSTLEKISQILGIDKFDTAHHGKSLQHFGIDSMMVAEIKQILYQAYAMDVEVEAVRNLSVEDLINFHKNFQQQNKVI